MSNREGIGLSICEECHTVLRLTFNFCPGCGKRISISGHGDVLDGSAEPEKRATMNPDRVGIFMDVLHNIIEDLNASEELRSIFGDPASRGLVIVADNNDLRIEDAGRIALSSEDQEKFLQVLDGIIRANAI
jgi:hypothetical protein